MKGFNRSIAIILGINLYDNGIRPLRTAVNDARRLGGLLAKEHGYEVWLRLDTEVTREKIERLLTSEIAPPIGPDDRVLFYFAGHGVAIDGDDGPTGYLLTQEASQDDTSTFLPMQSLHEKLVALPCRHLLAIFDCCFAGAFRWSSTRNLQPLTQTIYRERYERFITDNAWQVLTSAAHNQEAWEFLPGRWLGKREDAQEHSPFALALFDALHGAGDVFPPARDGQPSGDGVITATELYLYLRDEVEQAAEGHRRGQTPGLWPLNKHDRGEYVFLVPGRPLNLRPAPPLSEKNNPYLGLQAYDEQHKNLFFGRARPLKDLHKHVVCHRLTVLFGASSTGKTSLVRAGLLARLRSSKRGRWQIVYLPQPGDKPVRALRERLAAEDAPTATHLAEQTDWNTDDAALAEAVESWRAQNPRSRLLLVLDGFEELSGADARQREQFERLLAGALNQHADKFRLLIVLRSDSEAGFVGSPFAPWWQEARVRLQRMGRDELRKAIEGPASARVLYFEPGSLVDQLVEDVAGEPGALPWLSLTLSTLYLKYLRRQAGDRALSVEDYREFVGVTGLLFSRAEELYASLDREQQGRMRKLALRMIALDDERFISRRVPLSELEFTADNENEAVAALLRKLLEARLIVRGGEATGAAYIELAHGGLVPADLAGGGWPRLLEWMKDGQDDLKLKWRLTQAVDDWSRAQRENRYLWDRNPNLPAAESALESPDSWLNRRETEFVQQSIRQRSKNRLGRGGTWAILGLVALVAVIIFFAWRNQIQKAASGSAQKIFALANREAEQQSNPLKALLLACKAYDLAPASDQHLDAYALRPLYLSQNVPAQITNLPVTVGKAIFNSDATQLLTFSNTGEIGMWNPRTGEKVSVPVAGGGDRTETPEPVLNALDEWVAAFSPDNQWTAVLVRAKRSEPLQLAVWEAKTGRVQMQKLLDKSLSPKEYDYLKPRRLQFTADSKYLVLTMTIPGDRPGYRFRLFVWDTSTGQLLHPDLPIATDIGPEFRLSKNPSRPWTIVTSLAAGSSSYEARVIDILTGLPPSPEAKPMRHRSEFVSVDFSPDAERVVTAIGGIASDFRGEFSELHTWDASSGKELGKALFYEFNVHVLDVGPFAQRVLIGNHTNQAVRLWIPEDATARVDFTGLQNKADSATFFDNGRLIGIFASNQLEVWERFEGNLPLYSLEMPKDAIATSLSSNLRSFYSLSQEGTVTFRDSEQKPLSSAQAEVKLALTGVIYYALMTPDQNFVLTLHGDAPYYTPDVPERLQLWSLTTGEPVWSNAPTLTAAKAAWLSPDNSRVAVASEREAGEDSRERVLQVWDIKTGAALTSVPIVISLPDRIDQDIEAVAFTGDNSRILVATKGWVAQWDIASGQVVEGSAFSPYSSDGRFLGLSRDGSYVAVSFYDDIINFAEYGIWDTRTHQEAARISHFGNPSLGRLAVALLRQAPSVTVNQPAGFQAVLDSGGQTTASVSASAGLMLKQAKSVWPVIPPAQLGAAAYDAVLLRFSSNGKWVFTSSRVWETETGNPLTQGSPAGGGLVAGEFSPDAKLLRYVTDKGRVGAQLVSAGEKKKRDWIRSMGEALTGLRLVGESDTQRIPQQEYSRLRRDFFCAVQGAAASGDQLARLFIERWKPVENCAPD